MEQFREIFPNGFLCPKCDSQSSSLLYGYDWIDGVGSDRAEPRKIHGRDGVVLVGRRYKCFKKAHEVISYHPGILRQIKAPSLITFKLWSRTGFTSALTNDIVTMVVSGVSASIIESNLVSATVVQYSMKRKRFVDLQGISSHSNNEFPSYEQWRLCLPANAPSRHAISACFLSSFWEKYPLFEKHMQCTTITDTDTWLSCDHAFASAGKLAMHAVYIRTYFTQCHIKLVLVSNRSIASVVSSHLATLHVRQEHVCIIVYCVMAQQTLSW